MKKTICAALAAAMLAGLCGCGSTGGDKMSVMVFTSTDISVVPVTKVIEERTDKEIEWHSVDNNEQISLLFASGDYTDVIISNILQDTDVSKYAANGVIVPLDEYINEEITPNLCAFFERVPTAKAVSTLPDGHIYTLPRYNGIEADYVENYMFINKVWLDKLGLKVPETTNELYTVLKAFKERDPNGNGIDDEIPMTFKDGHAFSYPEALLSSWGVATKHGNFEGFTTISDGKVEFAPMLDEWREMIRYYRKLYNEGLLDIEAFTQSNEQYNAKLSSATSTVGMLWSKTNPFANADEYIAIKPVHAPGKEVVWRVHPGSLGIKNLFAVTNKCKDIESAMRWVDKFYTEEATLESWYGAVGDTFTVEDGMYKFNEPDDGMSLSLWVRENTIGGVNLPGVFYPEEVGTLVEDSEIWSGTRQMYELYKDYLDKETWPRPYYSADYASRISELRTDIFNIVSKAKAGWIAGDRDVDAEWDSYLDELRAVGVDEYIEINQKTYDSYKASMNK